ncbi:MAG: SecY-interacting protein [Moritella sp.]|uniref:SecY-interacting protein n=1 Tax=Moritella sp. TaxID=78556 RepID=UPI0029AA5F4D|nr:SecY-interacting protein [Moritella sp.]MDX2320297.1 SecY-interacting protein [Moritella sp.]
MTVVVTDALIAFYARCEQLWQAQNYLPQQEFDPEWDSPCFIEGSSSAQLLAGHKAWLPVKRDEITSFSNIESALGIDLDPQIADFFGAYFSDHMPATFNDESIDLVQVWNAEDFERLQENMIAHLMMKKTLKQSPTLFIASCADDMQIIALDNVSGEVVREVLGKGIVAILAPDLATFISQLTPRLLEQ